MGRKRVILREKEIEGGEYEIKDCEKEKHQVSKVQDHHQKKRERKVKGEMGRLIQEPSEVIPMKENLIGEAKDFEKEDIILGYEQYSRMWKIEIFLEENIKNK